MSNKISIPEEVIMNKIYIIRNQKVMLSYDLVELYQVETKVLNQQVKRNIGHFPERYVFKLTTEEYNSLRSQFVTFEKRVNSILTLEDSSLATATPLIPQRGKPCTSPLRHRYSFSDTRSERQ